MKHTTTLFLIFIFSISSFAQVQFPIIATSQTSDAERIASFSVEGAGNDRLEITNATNYSGQFVPTIWAYRQSDNRHVLGISTSIPSTIDNGYVPLMIFSTSIANNIQLNSPSEGDFPWGNTGSNESVVNRPLFQWRNNSKRIMTMTSSGNIGIGKENPFAKLDVNGNINTIKLLNVSDESYLINSNLIENALTKILALNGKTYNWQVDSFPNINLENQLQYGLIAQEVETVVPEIVHTSNEGIKSTNYDAVIPILIEAIKELNLKITDLETQITVLNNSNFNNVINANNKIISISPNPTVDQLTVIISIDTEIENAKLNVYDVNGKKMSELNIIERTSTITKTIRKENYENGIYFICLNINGKNIDSKKVIFK